MPLPLHHPSLLLAAFLALALNLSAAGEGELFEKEIRPILVEKCQACHGSKEPMGGLNLATAKGLSGGSVNGPVVDRDHPEKSRLWTALRFDGAIKMPPTGKLSSRELDAFKSWIQQGAPWPEARSTEAGGTQHWAFQAVQPIEAPNVKNESWPRNDIDRFILARLEQEGLKPAPATDKLTLLRRATFDLIGLPPSADEIQSFLSDDSPQAFATVVDRLLASPRYGERWGRHWLDVARYADSTGADEDHRYPHAWRYRDYVIEAFNRDLPYDQFVREQIAGDLLPPDNPADKTNIRGIIATGFLALGPKLLAEIDKPKMFYDTVDEQIDTMSQAILGLTIACARCHDHKFDPIPTKDYYSLASIFASSKQYEQLDGMVVSKMYFRPLVADEEAREYEAHQKRTEKQTAAIDEVKGAEGRRYRNERAPLLAKYMLAAFAVYEQGAEASGIAARESLEKDVLERWAAYLKPTRERRPQLEPWYSASDASSRNRIAVEYQETFLKTIEERDRALEEWKVKAAAAEAEGAKVPEKPTFFAGDDRFFSEVGAKSGPLGLPADDEEAFFTPETKSELQELEAQLKQLKESAPEIPLASAMNEGDIIEQPVLVRGDPRNKGEIVPKWFPAALAGGERSPIESGSGRLELGKWLGSASNPMTARVMVNRIWQWHFGEGLVRTPNNFGLIGERPTHPKLLDYLAGKFVESGWSVKQLHRLIMLSSAYQLSSAGSPEQAGKDSENRFWSYFSARRLDVEELRDSLLSLDGSLDLAMGGALMEGAGTDKEFSEDRKSLHPDKSTRRTVYLPLRRSNLPTLFNLFDFGDATTSTPNRAKTNVAPQALYMMNSDFVDERSRALAELLLNDAALDDNARLEKAHLLVLNRPASSERVAAFRDYLAGFPQAAGENESRRQAWASLCRALIASNEFLYLQ